MRVHDGAERDIRAAVAIGLLDAAVADAGYGAEAVEALAQLRAVRRDTEEANPTAELLAQRDEETR
jgi:hypothetical protein